MNKLPVEHLPFTVRIVHSPDDLQKAADLRRQAYARHIPEFAEQLAAPEAADTGPDTYVLLVESKDDAQEGERQKSRDDADSCQPPLSLTA